MSFLLDTNVAIHLRDGDDRITAKVAALDGAVLLSIMTRIELENGVARDADHGHLRRARLDVILASLPVLAFDDACADVYRRVVETAGYSRRKLIDRMIAAQAIVHRASLVTLNPADFRDVPELSLIGW